MNHAKALEILRESVKIRNTSFLHMYDGVVPPKLKQGVEALEIAIAAVSKQIPKKAVFNKLGDYIVPVHCCPDCGEQIGDGWRYRLSGRFCPNCGQRLSF